VPTATAPAIQIRFSCLMSGLKNVAPIAMPMPSIASWLPLRAVRGEFISFIARMKHTAPAR